MKKGDEEKWQKNCTKIGFFGLSNFFRHLYEVLDPKWYTWLESSVTKDSHGKLLPVRVQNFVNTLSLKSSHHLKPSHAYFFDYFIIIVGCL